MRPASAIFAGGVSSGSRTSNTRRRYFRSERFSTGLSTKLLFGTDHISPVSRRTRVACKLTSATSPHLPSKLIQSPTRNGRVPKIIAPAEQVRDRVLGREAQCQCH